MMSPLVHLILRITLAYTEDSNHPIFFMYRAYKLYYNVKEKIHIEVFVGLSHYNEASLDIAYS